LNLWEENVIMPSVLIAQKEFPILDLFQLLEDLHQLWVAIKASKNVSCYYPLVWYHQLMVIYYLCSSEYLYADLLFLSLSLFLIFYFSFAALIWSSCFLDLKWNLKYYIILQSINRAERGGRREFLYYLFVFLFCLINWC